jgi:hypothetical protein
MKRRLSFSVLACLAMLAGLPAAANAAIVNLNNADFPYDLGTDPTFDDIYRVTRVQFGPSSSFNHVFRFTLSVADEFRALAAAPNLGNPFLYFTLLDRIRLFSDPDANGVSAGDTFISGDPNGPLYLIDENLAAGAYYLRVAGDTFGAVGGRYYFAAHTGPGLLPAIPEPSTYALMLAGLGMIAFMTRRRQRRTARI